MLRQIREVINAHHHAACCRDRRIGNACDGRRSDPDPTKTGGSVEYHTPELVCGHSIEHRHFSNALRDEVLARYGLLAGPHPDYEIGHLVPVCLGGG